MPLIYSRDALAEIQTKLWRVLDAIRKGYFDPDSSRAARIAAQTLQEAEPVGHGELLRRVSRPH